MILSLLFLSGCVTREKCQKYFPPEVRSHDSVYTEYKEFIRDSLVVLPPDSSWLKILLDCKRGQARMEQIIAYRAGHNSGIPKVSVNDNLLTVKCRCDTASIILLLKDRYFKTESLREKTVTPQPLMVNYLKSWQWFFLYSGIALWAMALIIVLIIIVFKFLK